MFWFIGYIALGFVHLLVLLNTRELQQLTNQNFDKMNVELEDKELPPFKSKTYFTYGVLIGIILIWPLGLISTIIKWFK